jgi:preprotein translocase subunit YajC
MAALLAAANPLQSLAGLAPFILIFIVFYLFMIRPGQQRQKAWQDMLAKLKAGDKITTNGGLRGTVIAVREDVVQLRVPPDNLRLEVAKSAIATVSTAEGETK